MQITSASDTFLLDRKAPSAAAGRSLTFTGVFPHLGQTGAVFIDANLDEARIVRQAAKKINGDNIRNLRHRLQARF